MGHSPFNWLRLLYRLPLFLLLLFVALPLTLFAHVPGLRSIPMGRRTLSEFALNSFMNSVCRIFGVRPVRSGTPRPAPCLIVANHQSWLDIALLHGVAAMSFVAKGEIGRWPLIGWIARVGGTEFHERGNHESAHGVADVMVQRLKSEHRVAIFPEGGILPGPGVKRFHARLFKVAIEADCDVQPVMIRYLRDGHRNLDIHFRPKESMAANIGRQLIGPPGQAEVRFLDPIGTEGRSRRELAGAAETVVREAYEENLNNDGEAHRRTV